ncbi:nuclear transport factor 2 family protein [Paraburkholderia haematera]|uniref:SnoaL-like domain-containing protein n=1 Tax=Paraburkholderia haematera TaxID=2793077 RepID=A0ABN7L951_9BURK|nr:nuclear transport factor 2 family protein [Paraburkholderia haematera]CAE6737628.1 hypothetical protein R69888_02355 [Paraburkholderia haematera]
MATGTDISTLIRDYFAAYERKDRSAIEPLLSDDFAFSSPRDDHLSKAAYFEHCWPFNEQIERIHIDRLFVEDNEAFVTYACKPGGRTAFRNAEFIRTRNGQIVEVTVYFGSSAEDVSPT